MPATLRRRRKASPEAHEDVKRAKLGEASKEPRRSLSDVGITTSEELVKALKGNAEAHTSIDKIEIAQAAWDDAELPIPRKPQLLAEWILSVLLREARVEKASGGRTKGKAKEVSSIADPRYWQVLHSVLLDLKESDLRQLLGRQSLLPLFATLGHLFDQTSDLQVLTPLLDIVSQSFQLLHKILISAPNVESIVAPLRSWLAVVGRLANEENARYLFVPLRTLVLQWTAVARNKKSRQLFIRTLLPEYCNALASASQDAALRSCVCRLSFSSLFEENVDHADFAEACQLVCESENGTGAMATLLEQSCLADQVGTTFKDTWTSLALPFLRRMMAQEDTDIRHVLAILDVVHTNQLIRYDESTLSPNSIAHDLVVYVTKRLTQEGTVGMMCLIRLHQIDESAFTKEEWKLIVGQLLALKACDVSNNLLKALCSSFSRLRRLDTMVEILFEGVLLGDREAHVNENESILFQQHVWENDFGVALRDFISPELAIDLLEYIYRTLSESRSKSKGSDRYVAFWFYMSSYVVAWIGIPEPSKEQASNLLRKTIDGECRRAVEKHSTVSAAATRLVISIARRCEAICATDANWSRLMDNVDTVQDLQFQQDPSSLPGYLRLEILVAVLERAHRDFLRGKTNELAMSWLTSFIGNIQTKNEIDAAALGVIVSTYLPTVERAAPSSLLNTLGRHAVTEVTNDPLGRIAAALNQNAANLELHRWRKAFFESLDQQMPNFDKERTRSILAFLERLPHIFLPRSSATALLQAMARRLNKTDVGTLTMSVRTWVATLIDHHHIVATDIPSVLQNLTHKESSDLDKFTSELQTTSNESIGALSRRMIGLIEQNEQALSVLALPFSQQVQRVALAEYEECLLSVLDTVEKEAVSQERIKASVQIFAVLLCNGPEGSLTTSQQALASLLTFFVVRHGRVDTLDVVQIVEAIVTGKTILFRSGETSMIFALLTQVLGPRKADNGTGEGGRQSSRSIFCSILTSLITLVRLRPDAVAPLLPQLSVLLCLLVSLFRRPARAQALAGRLSTLPSWLDVQHVTLGASEARLYTRLCSAITSRVSSKKTTSKSERQSKGLARAFGTHALPVLLSYVRALTLSDDEGQTLFAMGEVREELVRAMFCLCDVVGTWQRNVLMDAMSDEGQRIVCRQLWRAYEAQRYKGD